MSDQEPVTAPESPAAGSEVVEAIPVPVEPDLDAMAAQVAALAARKGGMDGQEHLMLLEEWTLRCFEFILQLLLPEDQQQKAMMAANAMRLQGVIDYLGSKPDKSRLVPVPPFEGLHLA